MVLRLRTQVFEDCLLPVSFHMVPIVYHTMSDRIVDTITRCLLISDSFIAYEEVKVLHTALRR